MTPFDILSCYIEYLPLSLKTFATSTNGEAKRLWQ